MSFRSFRLAKDLARSLCGAATYASLRVTLPDGSTVRCYAGDGVHLSVACLDRVMESLVPTITGLYEGDGDAVESDAPTTSGPAG